METKLAQTVLTAALVFARCVVPPAVRYRLKRRGGGRGGDLWRKVSFRDVSSACTRQLRDSAAHVPASTRGKSKSRDTRTRTRISTCQGRGSVQRAGAAIATFSPVARVHSVESPGEEEEGSFSLDSSNSPLNVSPPPRPSLCPSIPHALAWCFHGTPDSEIREATTRYAAPTGGGGDCSRAALNLAVAGPLLRR